MKCTGLLDISLIFLAFGHFNFIFIIFVISGVNQPQVMFISRSTFWQALQSIAHRLISKPTPNGHEKTKLNKITDPQSKPKWICNKLACFRLSLLFVLFVATNLPHPSFRLLRPCGLQCDSNLNETTWINQRWFSYVDCTCYWTKNTALFQ